MELLQPDLHPPDPLLSTLPPPLPAALPPPDPPHLDPPKRQRRPSVRLGEIGGDPTYDPHPRRPNRTTWRNPKLINSAKTRPLTNLVNGTGDRETLNSAEPSNSSFPDFGQRKPKFRKPTKKARTNWAKLELPVVNQGGGGEGESSNNNEDEFDEDQVNSDENMGLEYWDQQSRGNRNGGINSNDEEKRSDESVGVRDWLGGLGLGRYAPVFEIHEVDDEVLPLLTMEDLKDMGINAVGSRRKMYSAILKLRKGFSCSGCYQTMPEAPAAPGIMELPSFSEKAEVFLTYQTNGPFGFTLAKLH